MYLTSDNVTPQFHVVFNAGFTTTSYSNKEDTPTNWTDLFHHNSEHYEASDFEDIVTSKNNEITRKIKVSEGDIPIASVLEEAECSKSSTKVSEGNESSTLPSTDPPLDHDIMQNNMNEDEVEHNFLHPPSNEYSSEGDNETCNEDSPKDLNINKEATTSTSSVGRKRFASKNLLKNVGNVKSKSALGFLYIISVLYVLNTPYFAYYAYRKIHYEQSYSFHSKFYTIMKL